MGIDDFWGLLLDPMAHAFQAEEREVLDEAFIAIG